MSVRTNNPGSVFLLLLALAMLNACAVLKDHESSELSIPVPASWDEDSEQSDISSAWLERFNDDALQELVKTTISNNYNQQIALSRVNAARSQLALSRSNLWPQISAGLNASRRKNTFDIGFGVQQNLNNSFGLSLASISWEADLWGRLSDQNKASLLDYQATTNDYRSARLSLAANVAKQWFNAVEAKLQVQLASETLENFEASMEIIQEGYLVGINQALDVHLARTNVANAESTLNAQKVRQDTVMRSLQLLAGVYPMPGMALPNDLPSITESVPNGVPADLLLRRPDVNASLLRMQASASRVDVAKKNRLPGISLTGSSGTSSDELKNLLDLDYLIWSLAGNISAPIFQGGRLKANQALAEYRNDEAFLNYANTVLNALVEIEGTLYSEPLLLQQEQALAKAVSESEAAEELAEGQYSSGLVDIITLLDTQRRLFSSRSALLSLRNQRLQNRIDLHLALAGEYVTEAHAGQLSE